jgi:hypothetical protein
MPFIKYQLVLQMLGITNATERLYTPALWSRGVSDLVPLLDGAVHHHLDLKR